MEQQPTTDHGTAFSSLMVDADHTALRWYAAYTRSRHEKVVSRLLQGMAVEHFLPVYQSVHRWNDRRAIVAEPLFPGYVFVRIRVLERMNIVSLPGVVDLVGKPGRPMPIADEELAALRLCLLRQIRMEPHPYLIVGRRVRIKSGPLADMDGILVRKKGQYRLVLSVSLISQSAAVEVDVADVEALASAAGPARPCNLPRERTQFVATL